MLSLLLLMGMAPLDGALPSGPPSPHLSMDVALQWRLSQRSDWQAFRSRWGGHWAARWDPRNGTPRFLYAPAVPTTRAAELVEEVAALSHVLGGELSFLGVTKQGNRSFLRYGRHWKGAEVLGDEVLLVAIDGKIAGIWVRLTPISLSVSPLPGEKIFVHPTKGEPLIGRLLEEGDQRVFRDRTGAEKYRYDLRYPARVEHKPEQRSPGDPQLTVGAYEVSVEDSNGVLQTTNSAGDHGLSGGLWVTFTGSLLSVNQYGRVVSTRGTDSFVIQTGTDVSYAASDVLYHHRVLLDWLGSRWPGHRMLREAITATVGLDQGSCNAWYTSGTVNFLREDPGNCYEFGRSADVIYHELGHGIHDWILAGGSFASDVSEGSADYIAATILEDPVLVPDAFGPGTYIREIDTDKRYPQDRVGESHADGLIWASFLWNLRASWGAEATDLLFLGALEQGPGLTDLAEAVLLADEDDGDLSNGTPHACELLTLLDHHGLGPGAIGVLQLFHTPPPSASSWDEGYPVDFEIYSLTADCATFDADHVELWYSTTDNPAPGTRPPPGSEDSGGADSGDSGTPPADPTEGWDFLVLTRNGDHYTGTIPRQLAGKQVRYFAALQSADGSDRWASHEGDNNALYSFWVGDQTTLWCEDFESGAAGWEHGGGSSDAPPEQFYSDDWVFGSPVGGGPWDPTAAWSGNGIAAIVLDGDYRPSNAQYLRSPPLNLTTNGHLNLLSFRRWLTVEDGVYDHARIFADQALLYENPASSSGSVASLDTDWSLQELDLSAALTDGQVQLQFELSSDAGLEYGGWQLDQLCITELADLPGHYQVHNLSATTDQPSVHLSWTSPWIEPLRGQRLIRKKDLAPTGPEDGEVLLEAPAAAGTATAWEDRRVLPGETWYYAVFAAGEEGSYYPDLQEGWNLAAGGVPADPVEESEPPVAEDSEPAEDSPPEKVAEEPASCGCQTGSPLSGLALLGLLFGRRKRH